MLWADFLPWGFPKLSDKPAPYFIYRTLFHDLRLMICRDDSTVFPSWVKRDRMHDLSACCPCLIWSWKLVGKNDKIHYEYRTGRIQSQRHWRQVKWYSSVLVKSNVLVPSVKCWILATPVEDFIKLPHQSLVTKLLFEVTMKLLQRVDFLLNAKLGHPRIYSEQVFSQKIEMGEL